MEGILRRLLLEVTLCEWGPSLGKQATGVACPWGLDMVKSFQCERVRSWQWSQISRLGNLPSKVEKEYENLKQVEEKKPTADGAFCVRI